MTISVYSVCSDETEQLNKNGYKLYIDKDTNDENTEQLKFLFETPDGKEPLFNYIYNKTEVDALVQSGMSYDALKNICLSAVNNSLHSLITYIALKYNDSSKALDTLTKNVQRSSNAIYELNLWNRDTINNIAIAYQELKNMIDDKNECHCMDKGGFHDQFIQFQNYVINYHVHICTQLNDLLRSNTHLLSPLMFFVSNFFKGDAFDLFTDNFRKQYAIPNEENDFEIDIINPNKEYDNMTIPKIDDPYHRTFDKLKPVYGTIAIPFDLAVNGLINGVDITDITPGDSYFTEQDGFDYYYVKNESVNSADYVYKERTCYKLSIIDIPQTTLNKLKSTTKKINVFRFLLRKNEIFDVDGTYIKEFILYSENNKLHCPVITKNNANAMTLFNIDYVEDETPFIAFDKECTFNPYGLLMKGELSIMNLLPQNTIVSSVPTIKCDIIEARNALKLHESNIMYFYKPTSITEDDEFYIMRFSIPNDYVIPINTNFVFEEFCFNNCWALTWNGNKWIGNNVQGKQLIQTCHKFDNPYFIIWTYAYKYFSLVIKHTHGNYLALKKISPTITENENYANHIFNHDLVKWHFIMSDGSRMEYNKSDFSDIKILQFDSHDGYDEVGYRHYWKPNYMPIWKELIGEITIGKITTTIKYSRSSNEKYGDGHDCATNIVEMDAVNVIETIDKIGFLYDENDLNVSKKDIVLKCGKDGCNPVPGIDWDGKTNAFQFIIEQQYYRITPNPNAADTLYTDFNITSSKIITADNITTMRSDLNVVVNTTDIIGYDVQVLQKRVDNIDTEIINIHNEIKDVETEVKQVEDKVEYLEKKVKKVEIIADVALGFSIAATVLSVGNTLEMAGNYISFGFSKIMNLCNRATRIGYEPLETMISGDVADIPALEFLSVQGSLTKNLDVIIGWCNSPHQDVVFDSSYYHMNAEDGYNPDYIYMSYSGVQECCNYYRDTLKPYLKEICTCIQKQEDRLNTFENKNNDSNNGNINMDDYVKKSDLNDYPTVDEVNGAFDTINNKLQEYSNDLKQFFKDDIIDMGIPNQYINCVSGMLVNEDDNGNWLIEYIGLEYWTNMLPNGSYKYIMKPKSGEYKFKFTIKDNNITEGYINYPNSEEPDLYLSAHRVWIDDGYIMFEIPKRIVIAFDELEDDDSNIFDFEQHLFVEKEPQLNVINNRITTLEDENKLLKSTINDLLKRIEQLEQK